MKIVTSAEIDTNEVVHAICSDGVNIFCLSWDNPAKIFKIDPVTMNVEKLTLSSGWNGGNDMCYCNGYLWVCIYNTSYFRIARVNPDFSAWTAAINEANKYWYPMSLTSANNKLYCGTVENMIEIDVSNPDAISYSILLGCPVKYIHGVTASDSAIFGWGFKNFNWTNPQNPAIFKYHSATFSTVDINHVLTDDMITFNGIVYTGSEKWSAEQPPVAYSVNISLVTKTFNLDMGKIGEIIDTVAAYKDKIWFGCRNNTYPLVEMDTTLTTPIYHQKSADLNLYNPNELLSLGEYLYAVCSRQTGKAKIYKLGRTVAITFESMPPDAIITID